MSTALAPPVQTSAQPHPFRTPEFTLGTALAWLAHNCTDRCSVALDTLGATIWFIQQPTSPWLLPDDTLIVLDLAPSVMPAVQIRRLLRQVNACARADGIRVCAGPGDDHASALAPVARDPDASKFRHELVAVASTLGSRAPHCAAPLTAADGPREAVPPHPRRTDLDSTMTSISAMRPHQKGRSTRWPSTR